jgi:peroxiredoxin
MTGGAARWAGRALLAALGLLLALDLVYVARNWTSLRSVTTPRGAAAPGFAVALLDGGTARLEDYRGQTVVLAFWATWCRPCRQELPAIDRLYRRLSQAGAPVRFLAVDVEGGINDTLLRGELRTFARALDLQLPIAIDAGGAASSYHVEVLPYTVILDGNGRVRRTLDGAHDEAELARAIDEAR